MIQHPAKYTDSILKAIEPHLNHAHRILDPFAGTGKLRKLRQPWQVMVLLELEPEWARQGANLVGNALHLPFAAKSFDMVVTSPVYGNRMSDHHNARDGSKRRTYRHTLGRPLHPANSGQLQWGEQYQLFHRLAWLEVSRVLMPGGHFLLNVSDHIRKGLRVPVTFWHQKTIEELGFRLVAQHHIETPRLRYGANRDARIEGEELLVFFKLRDWDDARDNID